MRFSRHFCNHRHIGVSKQELALQPSRGLRLEAVRTFARVAAASWCEATVTFVRKCITSPKRGYTCPPCLLIACGSPQCSSSSPLTVLGILLRQLRRFACCLCLTLSSLPCQDASSHLGARQVRKPKARLLVQEEHGGQGVWPKLLKVLHRSHLNGRWHANRRNSSLPCRICRRTPQGSWHKPCWSHVAANKRHVTARPHTKDRPGSSSLVRSLILVLLLLILIMFRRNGTDRSLPLKWRRCLHWNR
mmetsp:Transcript_28696/g.52266  ORF Transcript_28696/g.52266 Transcript_28696/m.52266 type:complete len:247 (-) Transcript_28696:631-1371(-)